MGTWRGVELSGVGLAEPGPGGLRLRPFRASDAPGEFAAMQDRSMHEFLPLPDPYTREDAREWCERVAPALAQDGRGLQLAMVGADDVALGSAGLKLPGPRSDVAEIGYSVHADARGHGLAARSARLLADWGFAAGVERLEVRAAVRNLASVRAALRAGFRFEGVHRHGVTTPTGVVDGAVFVRVRHEPGDAVAPWLPAMTGVGDDVLVLRPLDTSDAPALAEEMGNPESLRWGVGDPPPDIAAAAARTAARAAMGWSTGPGTRVAMVDRASGAPAGILELRAGGPPDVVELGYGVLPAFRGRGVTTRGLRLLVRWAFAATDIARFELGADVDNVASHRVAAAAGFTHEGVAARRLRRADGSFADEDRYGLVRPDVGAVAPVR